MKILVCPQNQQDINDIQVLIHKDKFNHSYYLLIDKELIFDSSLFNGVVFFSNSYTLSRSILLVNVLHRFGCKVLLSGAVLGYIRVALLLLGYNIKHIAYYRAILINPYNKASLGDKLDHLFRILNLNLRFFKNFYADHVLTIGDVNKNFLIKRGISSADISFVNLHKDILACRQFSSLKSMVLLTQAYQSHNLLYLENEQRKNVSDFININLECSNNVELYIKSHPRDIVGYDKSIEIAHSELIKLPCESTLILSPPSTYALELMLAGYKVIFFYSEALDHVYNGFYDLPGIPKIRYIDVLKRVESGDFGCLIARIQLIKEFFNTTKRFDFNSILQKVIKSL